MDFCLEFEILSAASVFYLHFSYTYEEKKINIPKCPTPQSITKYDKINIEMNNASQNVLVTASKFIKI